MRRTNWEMRGVDPRNALLVGEVTTTSIRGNGYIQPEYVITSYEYCRTDLRQMRLNDIGRWLPRGIDQIIMRDHLGQRSTVT
jgi:hypothetical protein